MDNILMPMLALAALVVAAVVLPRLLARKDETAGAHRAPARRTMDPGTNTERHYPITTIGIPAGHIYPVTTIGIPPGHVART